MFCGFSNILDYFRWADAFSPPQLVSNFDAGAKLTTKGFNDI